MEFRLSRTSRGGAHVAPGLAAWTCGTTARLARAPWPKWAVGVAAGISPWGA